MSMNPSEVPPRNTWGIILSVVIGFAISLSAVLITLLAALNRSTRIGMLAQSGIIGVFFCLPNIRDGQGWAKKLSIFGVILGGLAAGVGYVCYVMIDHAS